MKTLLITLLIICSSYGAKSQEINHAQLALQLEPLANDGDAEAQYHLGMMYHLGLGVTQDYNRAYALFVDSEKSGHPLSAYKVGCYYAGQGNGVVPFDYEKALQYKLIAAKAGYALAQYDVGLTYAQRGQTLSEIEWFERSALQGYGYSLLMLAGKFYEGFGIDPNPMLAYAYVNIAFNMAGGDVPPEMQNSLIEMRQILTPADQREAEQFIKNFRIEPSSLTIKAGRGLNSAVDYLDSLQTD